MLRFISFIVSLLVTLPAISQRLTQYSHADDIEVKVFGASRDYPWVGGFNNPQFSPIDLNGDGFEDIFIYEKHGQRAYTFLNDGIPGQISFTYAPIYEKLFPKMTGIGLLKDYNCDGKPDLFTQEVSDIRVFKNVGDSAGPPAFELAYPILPAQIFDNQSHVYTLVGDIPAIGDLNGNGKTDILSFHQLGEFASFFENISEDCDSLTLRRIEGCWGLFREDAFSATIELLDELCITAAGGIEEKIKEKNAGHQRSTRHPGSTLTQFDLSANGLPDLLIGDVESPYIKALYNEGTSDSAIITRKDSRWPANTVHVDIATKPAVFFMDVNNDGLQDAVVAPSEPNASEDVNNVWLYSNTGSISSPEFTFSRTDFLTRNMLDFGTGAHPKFVDFDGDGLLDLVVGNAGYFTDYDIVSFVTKRSAQIAYYRNTGTAENPEFSLETLDYDSLSNVNSTGLFPEFADMDNDGDLDMIAGTISGEMYYFENTAGPGNLPQFQLVDSFYMELFPGTYTTPLIYDLNKDGKKDLIVGQFNGTLYYYENTGTETNPQFSSPAVNTRLGDINYRNHGEPGIVAPFIAPYPQSSSSEKLFVGTSNGRLSIYEIPQDNPESKPFTLYEQIRFGASRITPAVADITNDGIPEIIYGQLAGGVTLLQYNGNTGACCVNGKYCSVTDETECLSTGGEFYGEGTDCSDIPECSTTNVSEVERKNPSTVKVYPNPSNGSFNIEISADSPSSTRVQVIDMQGKILQDVSLGRVDALHTQQFNLPLKSGLYIVRVVRDDMTIVKRLMIK